MNKKNDELKERLKVLELEQKRRDAALNNVELQAQIRKLRTLLFSHDEVGLSILTANKPITNLAKDNNQKLEQQNVRKIAGLFGSKWTEAIDLIYKDRNNANSEK